VPYATTSELPADVRAALPEDAQALFLRVVNGALNSGDAPDEAARIAWRGLGNAGWIKGANGVYAQAAPKRHAVAKRAGTTDRYSLRAPVTKAEGTDDECEVSGWASVAIDASGNAIVDHDNEIIPVPVLRAAAAKFLARSREFNAVDHYNAPCGTLTQSVIMDPATQVAMGFPGDKPVGWWVSAKIRGPNAKRARSGELREFSIEATAIKRRNADNTVTFLDLDVDRITLVDAGAGIGVRIESVKRLGGNSMNMDQILAKLSAGQPITPEECMLLMDALAAAKPADPAPEMEAMKSAMDQAKAGEEAAKKRLADHLAEAAMTPEAREETALKRLDPSVREMVVKARADAKAAQERADKRDEEDAVRVAKARAEKLAALPGASTDEIAFALRAKDSLVAKSAGGKSASEILEAVLAGAAEVVAKSALFRTIGGTKAPESGSAEAQLEAKARAIIEADPELKKLPAAKAMRRALPRAYDAHPDLYEQMSAEARGPARN
jgi:hypothetical protein